MQDFEKDLPDLIKYAKSMLAKARLDEDPLSIIGEAYILVYNSGYTKEAIKKAIANSSFLEKNTRDSLTQLHESGNYNGIQSNDIQCKKCKEVLPSAMFRVEKSGHKMDSQRTTCIECEKKIDRDRKRTYDKYKKNKPNKKTPYNSAYAKAYIQTLPNSYIIDVLKKQGHTRENITDQMIEEKRTSLQIKRAKKKAA